MKTEFQSPQYLYLLLLVLPLLGLSLWSMWRSGKSLGDYASAHLWPVLTPERSPRKRVWRDLFVLIGISLLLVALARPRTPSTVSSLDDRRGIELVACVDVSNSMLCQDLAPSRIDFTRQSLARLVELRSSDKLGIIAFAAKAYVQLPITADLKTAQQYITDLHPRMLSAQGTAIAEAIDLSLQSFSDRKDIGKAIVIFTDGENHDSDAVKAAERAQAAGVKVYVVGVGTVDGGPIPLGNEYLKDEDGTTVITRLNPELCSSVADAGSGSSILGTNQADVLDALSAELEHLPKAALEQVQGAGYIEHYEPWVWIGLIFLVLELLISQRKNRFLIKHKIFGNER